MVEAVFQYSFLEMWELLLAGIARSLLKAVAAARRFGALGFEGLSVLGDLVTSSTSANQDWTAGHTGRCVSLVKHRDLRLFASLPRRVGFCPWAWASESFRASVWKCKATGCRTA